MHEIPPPRIFSVPEFFEFAQPPNQTSNGPSLSEQNFASYKRDFRWLLQSPYLSDGVHINLMGQYTLYGGYRGAVKHALKARHTTRE